MQWYFMLNLGSSVQAFKIMAISSLSTMYIKLGSFRYFQLHPAGNSTRFVFIWHLPLT